jgi:hypothetical protein
MENSIFGSTGSNLDIFGLVGKLYSRRTRWWGRHIIEMSSMRIIHCLLLGVLTLRIIELKK